PSRAGRAVALRVGPPAQLVIAPSTHKLVVGSGETARVAISAYDTFGNPTSAAGVEITVDGQPRAVTIAPGGLATLTVDAPARFEGRERLTLGAALGGIRTTEELRVTGGPPARLTMDVHDQRL